MKIQQAMPHSLVLLMDYSVGVPPTSFSGGLVTATPTCVVIGTIAEDDGVASVLVTDSTESLSNEIFQIYDGRLSVPSKQLSLVDTSNRILATMGIGAETVDFQVWVDHPSEPENIVILLNQTLPEVV